MKNILLFLMIAVLTIANCTPDISKSLDKTDNENVTVKRIVCVEGHLYYQFASYGGSNDYSLKVDDNGKPLKCN